MNNVDLFNKFDIVCRECQSKDVEITVCPSGIIEVKCKCGNEEETY